MEVEAFYKRARYPCKITRVHEDGKYDVEYTKPIRSRQFGKPCRVIDVNYKGTNQTLVEIIHDGNERIERSYEPDDLRLCRDVDGERPPELKNKRDMREFWKKVDLDAETEQSVLRTLSRDWSIDSPNKLADLEQDELDKFKKLLPAKAHPSFMKEWNRLNVEREGEIEVWLKNEGFFVAKWYRSDWNDKENEISNSYGGVSCFRRNVKEGPLRITCGAWLGAYVTDETVPNNVHKTNYMALEFHNPGTYIITVGGRSGYVQLTSVVKESIARRSRSKKGIPILKRNQQSFRDAELDTEHDEYGQFVPRDYRKEYFKDKQNFNDYMPGKESDFRGNLLMRFEGYAYGESWYNRYFQLKDGELRYWATEDEFKTIKTTNVYSMCDYTGSVR